MKTPAFKTRLAALRRSHSALLTRKNVIDPACQNGIYERYKNPVVTAAHIPPEWRYDLNPKTNPFLLERIGINATPDKSRIVYAVLGDVSDPAVPGNVKKVSPVWPPAHVPTPFYLTPSGGLSPKPATTPGNVSFTYDPANPVPSLGSGQAIILPVIK